MMTVIRVRVASCRLPVTSAAARFAKLHRQLATGNRQHFGG